MYFHFILNIFIPNVFKKLKLETEGTLENLKREKLRKQFKR